MKYVYVNPQTLEVTKLSNNAVLAHFRNNHQINVNAQWLAGVDTTAYNIYPLEYQRPTLLEFQDIGAPIYTVMANKVVETSTVVDLSVEQCKDAMRAVLASNRYEVEVGGITLDNGVTIDTDRQTRPNLLAEYVMATANPAHTVTWKTSSGFITLDADTVIGIALMARAHVADCFRREGVVAEIIENCTTLDELRALDLTAEWDAAAPEPSSETP